MAQSSFSCIDLVAATSHVNEKVVEGQSLDGIITSRSIPTLQGAKHCILLFEPIAMCCLSCFQSNNSLSWSTSRIS